MRKNKYTERFGFFFFASSCSWRWSDGPVRPRIPRPLFGSECASLSAAPLYHSRWSRENGEVIVSNSFYYFFFSMQHIHSLILLTPTSYIESFFLGPRISLLYESDFHSVETNGLPAGKKKKKKLLFSSSPQLFFPWGDNFAFLLPLLAAHAPKRRGDGRSFLTLTFYFILFHFFFSGSLLTLRLSASIRWRREARDFDVRLTCTL